jgi:hypothetical protein
MRRFCQNHNRSVQAVVWLILLAVAAFAGSVRPGQANVVNQTVLKIGPAYAPRSDSDITRIVIQNAYDGQSLVQADSQLKITRTVKGKEVTVKVPVAASVSSKPGGGMVAAEDGYISFGTAGSATFMPGDKLSITLTFKGNVTVKTSGGLWLDVDKMNTPSTNGSLKIKSQKGVFDTSYTVSNALNTEPSTDPLLPSPIFSDPWFAIQNLAFLGNITSSQLDALSLDSIEAGDMPSGAIPASPSTFTLDSAASQMFTNPFPEPSPNLWDVALGIFSDPDTGTSYAFIDAFGGPPIPEFSTWLMLALGCAGLGLAVPKEASRPLEARAGTGGAPLPGYATPITSPSMSCFCVTGISRSTTLHTRWSRTTAGSPS